MKHTWKLSFDNKNVSSSNQLPNILQCFRKRREVTTRISTCWWRRSPAAHLDLWEGQRPGWWCGRGLCAPSVPRQRPTQMNKMKAARLDVVLVGRGQTSSLCSRSNTKVNRILQVSSLSLRRVSHGWANTLDVVKFGEKHLIEIKTVYACVWSHYWSQRSL